MARGRTPFRSWHGPRSTPSLQEPLGRRLAHFVHTVDRQPHCSRTHDGGRTQTGGLPSKLTRATRAAEGSLSSAWETRTCPCEKTSGQQEEGADRSRRY